MFLYTLDGSFNDNDFTVEFYFIGISIKKSK
ncbi:CRPV-199 [Crowpox virus]|nr:CRPV-199 [Crowpox virus]